MLRKISLCLSLLLAVSACQNTITPINNTVSTDSSTKNKKTILTGKVEFPKLTPNPSIFKRGEKEFNTKASLGQIITNSTVSLIYPDNYQTAELRGKSIATGLSDTNGNFSLNADYSFDPIIGQIFVLEATKRIKPVDANSIGDAISMRTYVQWQGSYFKSITKNSIYINTTTTAVAIMAGFNTIKPEDTIEKLNIGTNGQVEISNISFGDPIKTIEADAITYVKGLVDTALLKDQDPVGSIYYQQNKFLMKDILAGSINKLRGCISTSGNCNGLNVNIPTVTSLDANTPISPTYIFRKEDIQVNTTSIDSQLNPSIAVSRDGKKVVTWVSSDGNGTGIFGQRYDSNGAKVGNEFRVNTNIASNEFNEYGCKTVAMSDDGSFMVVWTQSDNDNLEVWGQRYDLNGVKIDSPIQINSYFTGEQRYPSISARGNGDYVVTWSSYGQDGSLWGIYAKQIFANGTTSNEIPVNTTTNSHQMTSDVSVNASGNFVITWTAFDSIWNVYAQRFNSDGIPNGSEFKVNTSGDIINNNPTVALDSNNNFMVTWFSVPDLVNGFDIMARKYDSTGTATTTNDFVVNTDMRLGDQVSSKVTTNDAGNFVVTWQDSSGNDGSSLGVHAKKYNSDGTSIINSVNNPEFIISKYRRKAQRAPLVAIDNSGKYSVVWDSYGQDGSEYGIYMQNFDFNTNTNYSPISGNQIGIDACVGEGGICVKGEQQINSFTLNHQQEVSIATNKVNGNHVAVWVSEHQDGSGNGIFAQMYNGSGQKQGGEIQVNGIAGGEQNNVYGSRAVGMDSQGNFIVVWMSHEAGNWQIRMQKFNSSGQKVGDEYRVNDTTGTDKMYPSVSMNGSGNFAITWSSQGSNGWDIHAKIFNPLGGHTNEFVANSTVAGDQVNSDVYLDDNNTYTIVWGSSQNGYWESFGQRYNADHSPLSLEFKINKEIGSENFNPTVIKDSTGKHIFTWHRQNSTTGYDVIARTMNTSGELNENELIVTSVTGDQGNPKIALLPNDKFIITWNDLSNSDGTGKKVKAKIFDSSLNLVGSEIDVNTFKGNNQYTWIGANQALPKVSTGKDGEFNIVWTSEGQDGSGKSVHIKRFNSNGTEK